MSLSDIVSAVGEVLGDIMGGALEISGTVTIGGLPFAPLAMVLFHVLNRDGREGKGAGGRLTNRQVSSYAGRLRSNYNVLPHQGQWYVELKLPKFEAARSLRDILE